MGIDRETLAQLRHLFRPLATRIANTVARAVVNYASDGTKLQLLQLGVLADETVDGAEHHQAYGFSSIPLAGAEAVVLFPNGDRSHPLVVAVSDRRHRPTGGEPGEVTVYNHTGAKITMAKDGDIVVEPASGRDVKIGDGASKAVVVQSALDLFILALTNAVGSTALSTVPMAPGLAALSTLLTVLTTGLCPPAAPIVELAGGWPAGTDKAKAE
jgi:phage gp45-like